MKNISKRQLERFPIYLKYLLTLSDGENENISSPMIAKALGLSEEQVRKDLQVVANKEGKPNRGRNKNELIKDIQNFLGYENIDNAIIIGVGHLGKAFINYSGFKAFGLKIVAGFDIDKNIIGTTINEVKIYSLNDIEKVFDTLGAKIAILTLPSEVAQEVVDRLIKIGIKAIWNFVPTHIDVSEDVVIENVNLASSLAVLSHKFNLKEKGE